jgi:PHD/YefM family antitoxin component YafN of YafNO toxin-antitoxin module
MDDPLPIAPPGWLEALAESEAELAAGKTVPSEPIMQRLRETIARLEAKRAGATAPTDTRRR